MILGALASVFAISTEEWQSPKLKLSFVESLGVVNGCLFLGVVRFPSRQENVVGCYPAFSSRTRIRPVLRWTNLPMQSTLLGFRGLRRLSSSLLLCQILQCHEVRRIEDLYKGWS